MSRGCTKCGAAVEPRMLASGACAYCGAALQHVVEAAHKAAVVRELLADRNGNGVPDVVEGIVRPRSPPKPLPWHAYVAIVTGLATAIALVLATMAIGRR